MEFVYALTFYTYPGRCSREELPIGLFATEDEARAVETRYRQEVPGFTDYYCDSVISPVPVPADWNGKSKLYSICGWNLAEEDEETDILRSDLYRTQEQARAALRAAKQATPRQKWSIDSWIVGQCGWAEGFAREYPSGREPLTLAQINQRLEDGEAQALLLRAEFQYSGNYVYLYPRQHSGTLMLGMIEDDFLLDGFTIRHLRDFEKLDICPERTQQICRAEGLTQRLTTPDISLESWQVVFAALQARGELISVAQETLDDLFFDIGTVESVHSDHLVLHRVDGDGVWQTPEVIHYDRVTAVELGSRYLRVFKKYL